MDGPVSSDDVAARLADEIGRLGIAGAILGVEHQGARWIVAVGSRDVERGDPMTADTSMAALSMVKPMTAALAMRAVHDGLLDIDQPVAGILRDLEPPFPPAVTVRQLLSMTAGLAEVPLEPPIGGDTHGAVASLVAGLGLADEPGTVWSYSNPAFAVLGRIEEVVFGAPWDQLMRQHVLRPAGMTTSHMTDEPFSGPVASDHVSDGVAGRQRPVPGVFMRAFAASGLWLLTTAADVLAFSAELIRDPALAALRVAQIDVPVRITADRWCLGIAEFDWGALRAWGWDGIGIGVRHIFRVVPDRQFAIVLLTNSDRGRLLLPSFIPSVVSDLLGVEVPGGFDPAQAKLQTADRPDLTAYQGTYRRLGLPPAIVTASRDHLAVEDLKGRQVLLPLDRSTFLADERDPDEPIVTFSRFDDSGRPRAYYRDGSCFTRS